jgi:hypothetical protein
MSQKLKKTLEELASCSAWTFDEALLLLTGSTSHQIDYKKSHILPPAPDIRYLLMSETKEMTWSIKEKQQADRKEKKDRTGHEIYTEGNTEPVPAILAKKFIKNGWAEDTESLAERKTRLKEEESQYQKAQGQFKLLETLKRAVQDSDIETLNNTRQLLPTERRLEGQSFLAWVHVKKETISQLRYFPSSVDDILMSKLLSSKSTRSTDKGFPPTILNKWSQVSFCVLRDAQFEIQVAGQNYTREEVFDDSSPEYLIHFLYQIIHNGGTFDSNSFSNLKKSNVREYKDRLNKLLKERFGINEDPIIYNQKALEYISAFKCESEISIETDSADYSPEDNTPSGVSPDEVRKSFKYNE